MIDDNNFYILFDEFDNEIHYFNELDDAIKQLEYFIDCIIGNNDTTSHLMIGSYIAKCKKLYEVDDNFNIIKKG